jgi:glyoxylase-like metal-dependent hydrolase (beta-lactamase superfamily II)
MRGKYSNKWKQVGPSNNEDRMWSMWTEPKFAIGQRCILVQSDAGNVLWDCITYLDPETIDFINGKGGLKAIVISHPHYYTTHLEWAKTFNCPVYLAKDDEEWVNRKDLDGHLGPYRRLFTEDSQTIVDGVTAVKTGGHFPGSLVLNWNNKLLIADSFVTTPVSGGLLAVLTFHSKSTSTAPEADKHHLSPHFTTSTGCLVRRHTHLCMRCRI